MKFQHTNKPKENDPPDGKRLKFMAIGDTVTKNLSIYEYGDDIIAVDYGIGFPEGDSFGVDFIIPDMTYLLENSHRVRGLFISHAHADHFAAVPYLLRELNLPIYCNKITQEYIKSSLEEKANKHIRDGVQFHLFDQTTGVTQLGAFKISAFSVNHSVPNSLGIAIDTPEGLLLHMADFKVDEHPVIDPVIDLKTIEELGNRGVLCLASDCLGSITEGFVNSESTLNGTFPDLFQKYQTQQIFITTISSNIARMYQIIDAAKKAGRKVVATGRSIDQSIKIARNLGYLPFGEEDFVDIGKAMDLPQDSLVYIIAGCFGQSGSALDRLSLGEHNDVSLQKGSIVIFSSEPNPPGVDVEVERVVSGLIMAGAEVIDHHTRKDLHVSGHGHKGDLSKVASLVKPKYFIPIGGGVRHIHGYKNMIGELGFDKNRVFELMEGDVIEFSHGNARLGKRMEVHDLFIDGTGISPVVIKDREHLSTDGVFVIVIPVSQQERKVLGKVDVVTRGFVYVKESKDLMGQAKDRVNKILDKNGDAITDWGGVKTKIEKDIQKFLYKQTGRNPLVIAHSIFI